MSRRITYLTSKPDPAGLHLKWVSAMLLMMDMIRAGHRSQGISTEARIQMDYALFSPDVLPAGACYQMEGEPDDEPDAAGIYDQAVWAEQFTVDREQS